MCSSAIQMKWLEVILEQLFKAAMMIPRHPLGLNVYSYSFQATSFLSVVYSLYRVIVRMLLSNQTALNKTACSKLTIRNKTILSSCASSYYGWLLLKCFTCTVGVRFIRVETNCGNNKNWANIQNQNATCEINTH